jgi:hypothetical protein
MEPRSRESDCRIGLSTAQLSPLPSTRTATRSPGRPAPKAPRGPRFGSGHDVRRAKAPPPHSTTSPLIDRTGSLGPGLLAERGAQLFLARRALWAGRSSGSVLPLPQSAQPLDCSSALDSEAANRSCDLHVIKREHREAPRLAGVVSSKRAGLSQPSRGDTHASPQIVDARFARRSGAGRRAGGHDSPHPPQHFALPDRRAELYWRGCVPSRQATSARATGRTSRSTGRRPRAGCPRLRLSAAAFRRDCSCP